MEARLSKRGGKLGVLDAVENARRSYAAGLSWGLMESVSSASRNRVAFLSYDQDLYAHECWFCRGDPASFIPRQFRLLWCAMKLYLGYISALQFWRWWSSSHPLALRVFHDMRPGETGHTPSFPVLFVPSLRQCAFRDEDVIDCLRDAGIDVCPAPVHVLVEGSQGARDTPVVKKHRTTVAFPRGSFVKVGAKRSRQLARALVPSDGQGACVWRAGRARVRTVRLLPAFRRAVVVFGALAVDDAEPPVGLRCARPQPRWRSVGQTCRAACYGEVGIPYGNRACSLGVYFFARRWFGFAARSPERAH